MSSFKQFCSMPNGRYIFIPFIMAMMAFILNFRILASCDMVMTKWSIDCSSSKSESCVYVASIGMGVLAKESIVTDPNSDSNVREMLKVCQWYSKNDKEWLWDNVWNIAFYGLILCTMLGAVACALLSMGSCCLFHKKICRSFSYSFGILAVLNTLPFLIFWKSDICSKKAGVCDETQLYCVDTCEMGSGSWQLFACSFIWISAMVTTWSIKPESEEKSTLEKDDASQSTDDDDDGDSVSDLILAFGHDEVIVRPKVKSSSGNNKSTLQVAETGTRNQTNSRESNILLAIRE